MGWTKKNSQTTHSPVNSAITGPTYRTDKILPEYMYLFLPLITTFDPIYYGPTYQCSRYVRTGISQRAAVRYVAACAPSTYFSVYRVCIVRILDLPHLQYCICPGCFVEAILTVILTAVHRVSIQLSFPFVSVSLESRKGPLAAIYYAKFTYFVPKNGCAVKGDTLSLNIRTVWIPCNRENALIIRDIIVQLHLIIPVDY